MYKIVNSRGKIVEIFNELWQAEIQLCYYLNNGHNYYLEYWKILLHRNKKYVTLKIRQ